jgi:hypothetical protein
MPVFGFVPSKVDFRLFSRGLVSRLQEIDWVDWVSNSGSPALLPESAEADSYPGLAAVDHSNPVVQSDLKGWLLWLETDVGFDASCPLSYFLPRSFRFGLPSFGLELFLFLAVTGFNPQWTSWVLLLLKHTYVGSPRCGPQSPRSTGRRRSSFSCAGLGL